MLWQMGLTTLAALMTSLVINGTGGFADSAMAQSTGSSNMIQPSNDNGAFQDAIIDGVNVLVTGAVLPPDHSGILWSSDVVALGSRYIRLYFDQITSPPNAAYHVKIFDQDSAQLLADYTATEFSRKRYFFTNLLSAGKLQVRLVSSSPEHGLEFRLAAVVREAADATPVPLTAAIRWDPVRSFSDGSAVRKAASAVALIHL